MGRGWGRLRALVQGGQDRSAARQLPFRAVPLHAIAIQQDDRRYLTSPKACLGLGAGRFGDIEPDHPRASGKLPFEPIDHGLRR